MLLCAQNGIHYLLLPVMFLIYSSCRSNDYCHSAFFYLIINIQKKKYLFSLSVFLFFFWKQQEGRIFLNPSNSKLLWRNTSFFFRLACNIIMCIAFNLLDFYRCAIQMDVTLTPRVMSICFFLAYFSSFLWRVFLDENWLAVISIKRVWSSPGEPSAVIKL